MSVSYAVDFAALLLLGANETMLVGAASAASQCTFRTKARSAPYRTLFSMASLVLTVKATGLAYTWLGGPPARRSVLDPDDCPSRWSAPRRCISSCNTLLIATAIGLSTRQSIARVWNENFLWSAPSYFVGALVAAFGASILDRGGYWMASLLAAPVYLTYRTYKVYMGRDPGSAAARRAGLGPPSRDHRGARARHRRQGSDRAEPHPARAGVRRRPGARTRHDGHRDPGREDRGAAARHRQARGARAHPVEAGSADAGRVPEDPHPPAGRRRDHQRRAVSLSGGAADPQPSRALGRQRAIRPVSRATRFRSARAFCRSSTTSTR